MKYQVTDNCNRGFLCEGRNYGIGFAFAQAKGPLDADCVALETIMPISPCKDYLNDVVWSEATGNPFSVYGLKTIKRGIFDVGVGLIVFKICGMGASSPSKYGNMDKDINGLEDNYKSIQAALNAFETEMKVDGRTEIEKAGDYYVAKVPLFWCVATYRVSLWSLLVRALRFCDKPDKALEYLAKLSDEDSGMLNYGDSAALQKLKKMLAGNIPTQDLNKMGSPHNNGIVAFKF